MIKTSITDFVKDEIRKCKRNTNFTYHSYETWMELFAKAGYIKISCKFDTLTSSATDAIKWCSIQFGLDHFQTIGRHFFFETEKDAMLFALRWA